MENGNETAITSYWTGINSGLTLSAITTPLAGMGALIVITIVVALVVNLAKRLIKKLGRAKA